MPKRLCTQGRGRFCGAAWQGYPRGPADCQSANRRAGCQPNAAYFLHNLRILRKLWGGPPGPRGPPWTRFSPMKSASYTRQQADGGVVPRGDPRTRGSAPQSMQTVQYWEKYAALD